MKKGIGSAPAPGSTRRSSPRAEGLAGQALAAAVLVFALVGPAGAAEQPHAGSADTRIRYVAYDPGNVVELWSTPGAVMVVQFADDETVIDVAASDSHNLISGPRQNFLFWKFKGCLIPQPVLVLTRTAAGKLRRYDFQVETHPEVCGPVATASGADPHSFGRGPVMTASAGADPPASGPDLRYISADDLAAGADVSYTVVFRYPGDDRARREAAARAARERAAKAEAALLLKQQTQWPSGDPYDGTRNYRYAARGDAGLTPRSVWDNGYSTAFVFPAQQRIPALFRIDPDGKEATADYSVHGGTVIASGTAREWRLRDGQTVMEIYDLGYNAAGQTPGTGTVSPYVQRTLKGGGNGG